MGNNLKRCRHGVSTYQVDKAYKGYTLFCPLYHRETSLEGRSFSRVYLMDMNGNFVHYWDVPGLLKMHADLLPNGHIITSSIIKDLADPKKPNPGFDVTTTLELDWDSNIVWRYDNTSTDGHDRCRLRNGNTVVMITKPIEDSSVYEKIKGGLEGSEIGGANTAWAQVAGEQSHDKDNVLMYTIVLTELTPQNEIVWEMDLSKALDYDLDWITPLTGRCLWPGLNSIEELPDGNLISTSYNLSEVFIWDKQNKTVKWRFGHGNGRISFPHDPHGLPNGNVLLFDNGRFHAADPDGATNFYPPDFSRVIEINPENNEIVWEYRGESPVDFYSTYISSCQRLPNGNTLICEGATGRIFEVTERKEVVWEYLSPFYHNSGSRHGRSNAVFRAIRYSMDDAGIVSQKFHADKMQHINQLYGAKAMYLANLQN